MPFARPGAIRRSYELPLCGLFPPQEAGPGSRQGDPEQLWQLVLGGKPLQGMVVLGAPRSGLFLILLMSELDPIDRWGD